MSCERLSSISLPTTLETIEHYAFFGCSFDTLIIPRNTRLVPELNASEWYGVLTGCRIRTLVFCGTDGLFLPTTFGDIVFPADGSGCVVFMGVPPTHIDLAELQWNYHGGEMGSGAFTVCFPEIYRKQWMPSGEAVWNEIPIRALTRGEEEALVTQNVPLFQDIDRIDLAADPGWSFDTDNNVTLYTESGWENYCRTYWGMRIRTLEFEDGIVTISHFSNPESEESLYPGPSSITAQTLLLSSTVKEIDLTNMVIERIIVASDNSYYHVANDSLIETATGKVIWQPESEATNAPTGTSAIPMETETTTTNPPATLEPVMEQGGGNGWVALMLGAGIVIAGAAAIVMGVKMRGKRRRRK